MTIRSSIQSTLRTVTAACVLSFGMISGAQLSTFSGNAQHTNAYDPAAADLNRIAWSTRIDTWTTNGNAHYGEPIVTPSNTVIFPVLQTDGSVTLDAVDGTTGTLKYTLSTQYVMRTSTPAPSYQPVALFSQHRLYYQGPGGTIYYVDNLDGTPTAPTQLCFYGLNTYLSNPSAYNATVYIDTPLTADSQGNLFFGFHVEGSPIAPFYTDSAGFPVSGYARIGADGSSRYVFVDAVTGDANIMYDAPNAAPAVSNDQSTIYVLAKGSVFGYAFICGLDSTTLATKYSRFITNPSPSGGQAGPLDSSTASPLVAPDGDVYLGLFVSPDNDSRGYLAHYSGDLSRVKTPGAVGWDITPGIVPASMVPSYKGNSSYLLFCEYNNYAFGDDGGDDIHRVAILDPNDETQLDWHPLEAGMVEMREVLTAIGCTPDPESPGVKNAVRAWSVNAPAVDPVTNSVIFNSADGRVYRWELSQNQFAQTFALVPESNYPYEPTCIGPDGTVFTIEGQYLFAMNDVPGTFITMSSSIPDMRSGVVGDSVQFSVHVTGGGFGATGTVTFTDNTFLNGSPATINLGTVSLVHGSASLTTNSLPGGNVIGVGVYNGSNFITASYSGDTNHAAASTTLVQKVHWYASSTSYTTFPTTITFGQSATITVNVAGPGSADEPIGMVTLSDGTRVRTQQYLDASGSTTFAVNGLTVGAHQIRSDYVGDVEYAGSSVSSQVVVQENTSTSLTASPNPATYGQSIQLNANVASVDAGAGVPAGSVSFYVDNVLVGNASPDSAGNASLSVANLSAGAHSMYAAFTGDVGWGGSTSAPYTEQVDEGTTTSVAVQPSPSLVTQQVSITATVTAADTAAGTPSGSVSFFDNGISLGTANVDASGHASINTSALGFGNRIVTAAFSGAAGWSSSSGQIGTVVRDNTTTTVTSSQNPGFTGQPVTFRATVVSVHAVGTPTGNVSFTDNGSFLGSAPVDGVGNAALTVSNLSFGSHSIVASYTGTNLWIPSSGSMTETINDGTPPSIPQNVTATSGPAKGQITVHWSPSTDPDDAVNHYEVWSAKKATGPFALIASPVTTTYVDSPGHNQSRFYFVVAVDSHGNRSGNSAVVSAKGL